MQLQLRRLTTGPATSFAAVLALLFTSQPLNLRRYRPRFQRDRSCGPHVAGAESAAHRGLHPEPWDADTRGGGRWSSISATAAWPLSRPNRGSAERPHRASRCASCLRSRSARASRSITSRGCPTPTGEQPDSVDCGPRTEFSIEVRLAGIRRWWLRRRSGSFQLERPAAALIEAGRGVLVQAGQDFT